MQCPHLVVKERGKTCRKLLEEGLDSQINGFDMEHYCRNDPTCCYYFRVSTEAGKNGVKNRTNKLTAASQSA